MLLGVCSGALLYVVIFEVIHLEKTKINVSGLLQFGALLFGFIITVLIKILSKSKVIYKCQLFTSYDQYITFLGGDSQMTEESQVEESVTELPPPLSIG